MIEPEELIEVLLRRHEILRALLDEPRERHLLVDALDDSKSTVYKGVSQLQERGLVEATSDGLRPTLFGIVALERYEEIARTATLGDVLADLPPGTIEPAALVGAEAVVPDRRSVDRHLARLGRMLRRADSVRGFSPAVSPRTVSVFHDRVGESGFEAEIVLTAEIVEYLRQARPAVLEESLSAETVTFYRTDSALPFSLLCVSSAAGEEVCIDLGRDGLATGLVVNETAASRRWAETEIDRVRRAAERLTPDELPSE